MKTKEQNIYINENPNPLILYRLTTLISNFRGTNK